MVSLAYLFERFPTFTQTFCVREVVALRNHGLKFPVFSIRSTQAEKIQNFSPEVREFTENLPKKWNKPWTYAHWKSRALRRRLRKAWGLDGDRQRANEAIWLRSRLQSLGVKHVHTHFAGMAARAAYWLNQISDISFSITAHANDFLVHSKQSRLPELFEAARFVITETDYSADYIQTHFPTSKGKVHRVYNGIDSTQFTSTAIPSNPPRILSVGRYVEKKGYFDLIKACALLKDQGFVCDIVGTGPLEHEMRSYIAQLGMQDRIHITGPKNSQEIHAMLGQCTLFVLACRHESDGGCDNLPTVILEAMSASRPIISTRVAGVPEMVTHGKTGLLIEEQNPHQLAEAMNSLLNDSDKAREFGIQGQQRVKEVFDVGVTTPQLIQLFRQYGIVA